MKRHAPKIAALLAYDGELLGAAGKRRVERHLAGCEACREALGSIRAYEGLVDEVRRAPVVEPDWSKMELTLAREARVQAEAIQAERRRVGMATPLLAAVAIAAAATLALWYGQGRDPHARLLPDVVEQPERMLDARAEARASEPVTGEITAVAVAAHAEREDDPMVELAPGTELTEGMTLVTEALGRIDARLGDATGIVVPESSRVVLDRLRSEQVELALAQGVVASEVAHREDHGRYVVRAGPYLVRVRGTRFAVLKRDAYVAVTVDDGVVEVLRGQRVLATVRAPGMWRSDASSALSATAEPAMALGQVPMPRGLDALASEWPVLRLAPMPGVRAWRIGGVRYSAASVLAMRVPQGELEVFAIDPAGLEVRHRLQIGADGAIVDALALAERPGVRPQAPRERQGFLPEEQIVSVVRSGNRRITRLCQEVIENAGPDAPLVSGRVVVRVTIGRTGEVSRAEIIDARGLIPNVTQQCVLAEARRMHFPPPTGGSVTFDAPFRFTH